MADNHWQTTEYKEFYETLVALVLDKIERGQTQISVDEIKYYDAGALGQLLSGHNPSAIETIPRISENGEKLAQTMMHEGIVVKLEQEFADKKAELEPQIYELDENFKQGNEPEKTKLHISMGRDVDIGQAFDPQVYTFQDELPEGEIDPELVKAFNEPHEFFDDFDYDFPAGETLEAPGETMVDPDGDDLPVLEEFSEEKVLSEKDLKLMAADLWFSYRDSEGNGPERGTPQIFKADVVKAYQNLPEDIKGDAAAVQEALEAEFEGRMQNYGMKDVGYEISIVDVPVSSMQPEPEVDLEHVKQIAAHIWWENRDREHPTITTTPAEFKSMVLNEYKQLEDRGLQQDMNAAVAAISTNLWINYDAQALAAQGINSSVLELNATSSTSDFLSERNLSEIERKSDMQIETPDERVIENINQLAAHAWWQVHGNDKPTYGAEPKFINAVNKAYDKLPADVKGDFNKALDEIVKRFEEQKNQPNTPALEQSEAKPDELEQARIEKINHVIAHIWWQPSGYLKPSHGPTETFRESVKAEYEKLTEIQQNDMASAVAIISQNVEHEYDLTEEQVESFLVELENMPDDLVDFD